MTSDRTFFERNPSLESYWRAIVLFGLNVASYKFALAKSLLERPAQAGERVSLEELGNLCTGRSIEVEVSKSIGV